MNNNATKEMTERNPTTKTREIPPESHSAGESSPEASEALKETAETLKREGNAVLATVRQSASKRADQYTDQVSSSIRSVERATRGAADQLRNDEPEFVTQAFDWISDQTESVAKYLEERDSKQLLSEATSLIKRNPGTILGSLAAAGFLAGRFMKATDGEKSS